MNVELILSGCANYTRRSAAVGGDRPTAARARGALALPRRSRQSPRLRRHSAWTDSGGDSTRLSGKQESQDSFASSPRRVVLADLARGPPDPAASLALLFYGNHRRRCGRSATCHADREQQRPGDHPRQTAHRGLPQESPTYEVIGIRRHPEEILKISGACPATARRGVRRRARGPPCFNLRAPQGGAWRAAHRPLPLPPRRGLGARARLPPLRPARVHSVGEATHALRSLST